MPLVHENLQKIRKKSCLGANAAVLLTCRPECRILE